MSGRAGTGAWGVERLTGSAAELHARPIDDRVGRTVQILEVADAAFVLGSAQRAALVDAEALERRGVELVRRRSGGGAVLLEPGFALWIDLVIPSGDPLWDDDVGRASRWVGCAWADALGGLGLQPDVHRGPMVHGTWSHLLCFAGLGPGEVTVAGRKAVGISQRRTRSWARFQTVALFRWSPADSLALCALDGATRSRGAAELEGAVEALAVDPDAVADAVIGALPR